MFEIIKMSITDPLGYEAAAVRAGFKRKRKDLCIVKSQVPAVSSVKFTKNLIKAAPLLLGAENLKKTGNRIQAFVVNSGNANAGTGHQGYENAKETAAHTAAHLGLDPEMVLVSSTGVIGHQLDMKKMRSGLDHCCENISKEGGSGCAEAILTTDTVEKAFGGQLEISGKTVTLAGITKGSGMIAPNMATTLAFISSDLNISQPCLDEIFTECVEKTYNRITVDGHMSTNDTALIMANGLAGNEEIRAGSAEYFLVKEALLQLMTEMALSVVRDGEGATKFVQIDVTGAATQEDARIMAFAVANSALVKTALFGMDANWGRILSAAGMTTAVFDPNFARLNVNGLCIFEKGEPVFHDKHTMAELLKPRDIHIQLAFSAGEGRDTVYTSDLSYDYVKINAEYHT